MARPRVLLTTGDPAGIGPPLVLRACRDESLAARLELAIVGPRAALETWSRAVSLELPDIDVLDAGPDPGPVEPGRTTAAGALAALAAVREAARLCLKGQADAVVTAPVSKAAILAAGEPFTGHTEFLSTLSGGAEPLMTFVAGDRRVALVTTHACLREVPELITGERVLAKLRVLESGLRDWFGVAAPAIAVAGLNPHCGEGGVFGREEEHAIAPAVANARGEGIDARGPFPADTVYTRDGADCDAVLAMYHDQGTIAAKLMAGGAGVNITLGLPLVRTSVDHGTAFDLARRYAAGEGPEPEAASMLAAVRLAGEVAGRRRKAG